MADSSGEVSNMKGYIISPEKKSGSLIREEGERGRPVSHLNSERDFPTCGEES